ncbi:MAG: ROK family protein [Actinomycetota bacterium]|nr:ROK family protein [Actinomycetota bacterium]
MISPAKITVGIDLGGTHVRVALVDADGTVLLRERRRTPHDDPEPTILVEMARSMLDRSRVQFGDREVSGVVVGVPGLIDYYEEQLLGAPNLPASWTSALSESWLSERIGAPIALANDADLAAVGEANFGAGRGLSDVVFVTISTGIGAGTVLNGRLVHGRYSACEVGHIVIDRIAAANGRPKTVEDLGSGTALARRAAEAGLAADGAELAAMAARGWSAPPISGAAGEWSGVEPDVVAAHVWREALGDASLGIVNLCWLMAPQLVVVGGGVGMNAELVLPIIRQSLAAHGPHFLDIDVTSAVLGDDAGLAGAAAWWKAVGRHE